MSGADKLPVQIGPRPIVAKTCSRCHLLLPGSEYQRAAGPSSSWRSWCRTCNLVRMEKMRQQKRKKPPACLEQGRLVARTCSDCGLLKMADEFYVRASGSHVTSCKRCNTRTALSKQTPETRAVSYRKGREATKPIAHRDGYLWTGPEMEAAGRRDLTAKEVAVLLGRTQAAVKLMRWKIRREEPKAAGLAGVARDAG